MAAGLLVSGCEDPAEQAAAKQKNELEELKKQILEAGDIQEKRARKCHADIKSHFAKAVGEKRGSFGVKPKDKMGVGTGYAVDTEPIGKPIEGVKYVRDAQACEDVNEAYHANYKQGKWPDETRSDARRHKHGTETLAKLKEPAPDLPAAVAAYGVKCDKTPFKQYDKVSLNNYACTLQVVWLDTSGTVLAAAAGKGEGKQAGAPSAISEKTLQTLDEKVKTAALEAAAADIAKQQASW
jgi:hypothetical protein